jgi:hypothetical protein
MRSTWIIHAIPLDHPKPPWMDISWISVRDPAGWILDHGPIPNPALNSRPAHILNTLGRPLSSFRSPPGLDLKQSFLQLLPSPQSTFSHLAHSIRPPPLRPRLWLLNTSSIPKPLDFTPALRSGSICSIRPIRPTFGAGSNSWRRNPRSRRVPPRGPSQRDYPTRSTNNESPQSCGIPTSTSLPSTSMAAVYSKTCTGSPGIPTSSLIILKNGPGKRDNRSTTKPSRTHAPPRSGSPSSS